MEHITQHPLGQVTLIVVHVAAIARATIPASSPFLHLFEDRVPVDFALTRGPGGPGDPGDPISPGWPWNIEVKVK